MPALAPEQGLVTAAATVGEVRGTSPMLPRVPARLVRGVEEVPAARAGGGPSGLASPAAEL